MTDNTPLNADDELDKYLFVTWNMKDTVINRAMADGIKKWLKKHELQAVAELREELVDFAEDVLGQFGYDGKSGGLSTLEWAESIIKQHRQELEKL